MCKQARTWAFGWDGTVRSGSRGCLETNWTRMRNVGKKRHFLNVWLRGKLSNSVTNLAWNHNTMVMRPSWNSANPRRVQFRYRTSRCPVNVLATVLQAGYQFIMNPEKQWRNDTKQSLFASIHNNIAVRAYFWEARHRHVPIAQSQWALDIPTITSCDGWKFPAMTARWRWRSQISHKCHFWLSVMLIIFHTASRTCTYIPERCTEVHLEINSRWRANRKWFPFADERIIISCKQLWCPKT